MAPRVSKVRSRKLSLGCKFFDVDIKGTVIIQPVVFLIKESVIGGFVNDMKELLI